jgi:hypothetical protein
VNSLRVSLTAADIAIYISIWVFAVFFLVFSIIGLVGAVQRRRPLVFAFWVMFIIQLVVGVITSVISLVLRATGPIQLDGLTIGLSVALLVLLLILPIYFAIAIAQYLKMLKQDKEHGTVY